MHRTALLGLLLIGMLGGCVSNVTLKAPTIPEPLLAQIQMSVGVRMPVEFEHYVHEEMVYGHEEWSIDLGRSNAALFEQLFAYMFSSVTVLGPDDDPQLMGLDALIEPTIDAFEFSTPGQSNTEAFAVWIRYRLKGFRPRRQISYRTGPSPPTARVKPPRWVGPTRYSGQLFWQCAMLPH